MATEQFSEHVRVCPSLLHNRDVTNTMFKSLEQHDCLEGRNFMILLKSIDTLGVRRKNRRIGCPPDSVNLAMRFKMKGIQEQSNTTTRIQCHEINFQNKLNLKVY